MLVSLVARRASGCAAAGRTWRTLQASITRRTTPLEQIRISAAVLEEEELGHQLDYNARGLVANRKVASTPRVPVKLRGPDAAAQVPMMPPSCLVTATTEGRGGNSGEKSGHLVVA